MSTQFTLQVTGMTCGGCEAAVSRAVSRLPGVASVVASHKDGTVTVQLADNPPARDAIVSAIERIGYHVAK